MVPERHLSFFAPELYCLLLRFLADYFATIRSLFVWYQGRRLVRHSCHRSHPFPFGI
jgi:hypothetical protein